MKKILMVLSIIALLSLTACTNNNNETSENDTNTELDINTHPYIENIEYSNLMDNQTQEQIKSKMIDSGINPQNVDNLITLINEYNSTVGDIGQVKEGFENSTNLNPEYNYEQIDEKWNEKHPDFVGYNCRMTAFLLMNDLINIDGTLVDEPAPNLFFDTESIEYSNNSYFTEQNIKRYNTFYKDISTPLVKDINVHIENIKKYWADKKISFKKSNASLITVWIHNDLDENLFIGHTGVLIDNEEDNNLLFIEKLTFSDPYQVIKFKDRIELNDYLMSKYDVSYNQPTAKAFILENGNLLHGYRINPNNK